MGKNFYRQREGAICRNSIVSSDSHLEIDHWWSDQHHLDCFKYNQSSVPDLVCSRFCEASSRNCGSFYYGYGESSGTPLQYSCLEHPWTEEAGRLQSMGSLTVAERLHFHFLLSCIGEGNGNPLQCSCPENPRDGGAWWAAVSGVAQSRTRLK